MKFSRHLGFFLLWTMLNSLSAQNSFVNYIRDHRQQNFYVTKAAMDAYYNERNKGRGTGYTHYQRWRMNTERYVYPSGEMFNIQSRIMATHDRFVHSLAASPMRTTHGAWQSEGPTDYELGEGWNGGNGRVNAVAFHPTNLNTIYACTPAGGLWVTRDNGTTWQPRTDGIPSIGVSGVVVHPQDTNIIYLLTGDCDAGHTASIGVLKSIDGGVTWNPSGLVFSGSVYAYKILMHPTHPDTLYVAASNGLWRSLNAGVSWTQENSGSFTDIEFKPGTPSTMYGVTWDHFYRSTNSGDTWNIDGDSDFPSDWCRMAIGVTPANANYVYLLFGGHVSGTGNGDFSGLCRSTNSGVDFTMQSSTPNLLGYSSTGQDSVNQACYDLAIAIDPTNANTVYVGGINVWKSTTGGATGGWTITSHWIQPNSIGYTHADIHALEFRDTVLYCGSDGGVYRTFNDGTDWESISAGLAIMQFYYLDAEVTTFAGGTQDNGCNQWNTATDVAEHSRGADGFACLINPSNTNIRYQSTQGGKYRTSNGGISFSNVSVDGINEYWDADWILDHTSVTRLFVAAKDIWRSINSGNDWTDLNSGFDNDRFITSLAQGLSTPTRLYASDEETLRTTSNALSASPSWSDISEGLPVDLALISDIAVDPANASRLWVTFYGLSNGNKVFFSSNAGDTWTNISTGLPNIPVNCIVYHPGSNDGLYIGTDFGVFHRSNDVEAWIFYSNGLPNTRVFDLDIEGSTVYAATFGRGLWSSDLFSCDVNLVLTPANDPSGDAFTGIQQYHASETLTSTRIITGGLGTDVTYHAGISITLLEGFHARADNLFEAKLEGCPD